jgi:DNA-binding protein YbaB
MFDKLKDLYELQKQASSLKKELAQVIVEAEEENGTIKIVMNGEQKIQSINIADEWFSIDKKSRFETALKKCFSKAVEKTQMAVATKLGPMAKNFKLPF